MLVSKFHEVLFPDQLKTLCISRVPLRVMIAISLHDAKSMEP